MVDQAELMVIFSTLATNKSPVTLYNTYRGLPFNYSADILKFEAGMLSTRVHRYQAISMTQEGCTHLQNRTFREVIRANVDDIDYRMMEATLCEFTPAGDSIGKRMATRVQPSDSIEAEVSDGRRWVKGRIADISLGGLCFLTLTTSINSLSLGLERDVSIDFIPPGHASVVRFDAVITNIREQEGSYLHRLGLRLQPDPDIQPLMKKYIVKQQQVIMNELEQACAFLCHDFDPWE